MPSTSCNSEPKSGALLAGVTDDSPRVEPGHEEKFAFESAAKLYDIAINRSKSLAPLLPVYLNLNGKPYSLERHMPMEPMFHIEIPWRTVWKCGRQVGKCGDVDSQVQLANGRLIRAGDVKVGDRLISMTTSLLCTDGVVKNVFRSGRKNVLRIKTRTGSEFGITAEHRLKTLLGYTEAKDLTVGSRVAKIWNGGVFEDIPMSFNRVVFTAYMIGDGSCATGRSNSSISFTSNAADVLEEIIGIAEAEGVPTHVYSKQGTTAKGVVFSRKTGNQLRSWLEADNLWGRYSYEKTIPNWVFDLSHEDTVLFISRLWATDGTLWTFRDISYCSTSKQLAKDIVVLLRKLGINSCIRQKEAWCNGARKRDAYIVRVEGFESATRFLRTITVPGKPAPTIPTCARNNNRHTIPIEVQEVIRRLSEGNLYNHKNSLRSKGLRNTLKYPLSHSKLQKYIDYFSDRQGEPDHTFLRNLQTADIFWDEVVSIEAVGERETVDFEIETYHNFSLDGVISHNSMSLAAQGIIQSAATPHFKTLYVCPLYEQIRRFSANYIKPFINESNIKDMILDSSCEESVLQKSFSNQSKMFFSFAYLNCDRIRGLGCDCMSGDEIQDLDWDFLPIIEETLSASEWNIRRFTGTPKTMDNTIQALWEDSSQGEWVIQCKACKYWNIPSSEFDIIRMIGPVSNIKSFGTAVVCAKCGGPVHPADGGWQHRYPDRRSQFSGYHVPQIILPIHYAHENKWTELLTKMQKRSNAVVLNECFGESCDVGTKLVTLEELKQVAILHKLDFHVAKNIRFQEKYIQRILGVDWGGGGETETSYTTITVIGLRPDYKQEVIWGERMHAAVSDVEEVRRILEVFSLFQCHYLAHDFGGSGSVHETLILQSGFPMDRVVPFSYTGSAGKTLIGHHPPEVNSSRHYYSLNKTWSLVLLCTMIKTKHLLFPEYQSSKDLLEDFLHIYEHKTETTKGDVLLIRRSPKLSDDFVHSTNFAACAHYHTTQHYPDFARSFNLTLSDEQMNVAQPPGPVSYD